MRETAIQSRTNAVARLCAIWLAALSATGCRCSKSDESAFHIVIAGNCEKLVVHEVGRSVAIVFGTSDDDPNLEDRFEGLALVDGNRIEPPYSLNGIADQHAPHRVRGRLVPTGSWPDAPAIEVHRGVPIHSDDGAVDYGVVGRGYVRKDGVWKLAPPVERYGSMPGTIPSKFRHWIRETELPDNAPLCRACPDSCVSYHDVHILSTGAAVVGYCGDVDPKTGHERALMASAGPKGEWTIRRLDALKGGSQEHELRLATDATGQEIHVLARAKTPGGKTRLFQSNQGTWTERTDAPAGVESIAANGKTLWAVASGNLHRSDGKGFVAVELPAPSDKTVGRLRAVSVTRAAGHVWVVAAPEGKPRTRYVLRDAPFEKPARCSFGTIEP